MPIVLLPCHSTCLTPYLTQKSASFDNDSPNTNPAWPTTNRLSIALNRVLYTARGTMAAEGECAKCVGGGYGVYSCPDGVSPMAISHSCILMTASNEGGGLVPYTRTSIPKVYLFEWVIMRGVLCAPRCPRGTPVPMGKIVGIEMVHR